MPSARWPYPRIIAHRGAGRFAPENTLAALRKGYEMGFRAVEFDVMLSANGEPVLIHDETLERTTNGRGRVADHDAADLKRLDAGAWFGEQWRGEPLPGFDEAALLCRQLGLWANIEIKPAKGHEAATGRAVAKVALKIWKDSPLPPLLSSFEVEGLAAAREAAPALPLALLVEGIPEDWKTRLKELDCRALHCDAGTLEGALVESITSAGYGLAAWTVNDPGQAHRLFTWGVDAMFTDRLDLIGPDFAVSA